MEFWLWAIIGILTLTVLLLSVKIHFMRKAAQEIKDEFADKLMTDTNTLIGISSQDRYMRELAAGINTQLRKLRSERHRFTQGDLELKEAVTNISHDLRTPLTAICGYLDLLEQEEQSEEVRRYLEVIRSRTEVLKALTEELFRYSIVTSISCELVYGDVVLNSVLEESISAYYAVLKGSKITPKISMPEESIHRRLDQKALSRIFENVLSNAVKYSDGDLEITLTQNGKIVFANHASGLDEIQVGKLFNRFYTVETARKSTGLGLSIAKILTEQMNGRITAAYSEGMIRIEILFPEVW